MKYRLFCLILLLAVLLASCGEQSHTESQEASAESSYGESSLETVSEEQMPESLFEEAPYAFVFTSYGDGTCAITDILTDPRCTEAFDLEDFRLRLGFCLFCERLFASLICAEGVDPFYDIAALASVISEEIEYSDENTTALIYGG